eukprot:CAMPEP_0197671686 /NCGR_PEP_ID=MMETSP1338-20131121/77208_1 /TAXON_ID=43686 ORGANISM="Pelagodinium beii, Strain RCC1491" /NCGR_SAMPLE_ID=MMETSP1338 /ASSEMBLY_ACC=CAM_ASM_000754 /LENGTH=41 /DNA_ID= /DNA_START= /DNA_END= /DNA_ORIENTATION=
MSCHFKPVKFLTAAEMLPRVDLLGGSAALTAFSSLGAALSV